MKLWLLAICLYASALVNSGCKLQPPGGAPIQPATLGSVVDEVNRTQEENAEAAKFIVYMHEFEPNTPNHAKLFEKARGIEEDFEFQTPDRSRGFRLNPAGQDHVRQIAQHLMATQPQSPEPDYVPHQLVVVERSDTSKRWDTIHRNPVHFNDEIDAARRRVVVNALSMLGVLNAESAVVVAPAFPEGLNASEASQAYSRGFNYGGGQTGGGGSGGANFGGGGFGGL